MRYEYFFIRRNILGEIRNEEWNKKKYYSWCFKNVKKFWKDEIIFIFLITFKR